MRAICDRFGVAPVDMGVIGESLRGVDCAWALGVAAILVLNGKGAGSLAQRPDTLGSTPIHRNLAAALEASSLAERTWTC